MIRLRPEPSSHHRTRGRCASTSQRALAALCAVTVFAAGTAAAKPPPGAVSPRFDPAHFRAVVDNPYFPLVPGTTFKYVERLGRTTSDIEIAVTPETKDILGVRCIVVRERVWEKGKLTQTTDSWHAQDAERNVWIFGEDAREFLERGRVNTEGSWEAGVDGAEAGIVMPGTPAPGPAYRHGYLAGIAEDMAQIVGVADSASVPFGRFTACVRTKEWSMLESGTDKKWYAPGVGLVRALSAAREEMVLVSVSRP